MGLKQGKMDKGLVRLLDSQDDDQSEIVVGHQGRRIGLAKLTNEHWREMSSEEKKERIEQMKKKHRSAIEFFEAKDLRRTEFVEQEIVDEIARPDNRWVWYLSTKKYKCVHCGGQEFFVELVSSKWVVKDKKKNPERYQHTVYRYTCMNTACKRYVMREEFEYVPYTASEKWQKLARSVNYPISITVGDKTMIIPRE